jgi:hypothetical protein
MAHAKVIPVYLEYPRRESEVSDGGAVRRYSAQLFSEGFRHGLAFCFFGMRVLWRGET